MTILRRRLLATTTAAVSVLALSACGTNFGAQTNQQYQAAEGANKRGAIDVMNTVLVANADGTAVLSAGVVNQTDDEDAITDVTVTGPDGELDVTRAARDSLLVPPGGIVRLGSTEATAFVAQDAAELAGRYVTITVTWATAPATTIEAPVVERTEAYTNVVGG